MAGVAFSQVLGAAQVADAVQFRQVGPADASALACLFAQIDTTYFRPHAMTANGARQIAARGGRDCYLIGVVQGTAVAYGMLRGWDEGYAIPSLGVAVRRDLVGRGLGRATMLALHEIARREGAHAIRLRVHPDNRRASSLYRSLGYRVAGWERGEIVMVCDVARAP